MPLHPTPHCALLSPASTLNFAQTHLWPLSQPLLLAGFSAAANNAIVLLGTANVNQTQKEVRVVGYRIDDIDYWVATDRHDLAAEQVAFVYKLRWQIEKFFAWWKRHLKVYHLIARTEYGLMVQILSGLITYLLLAIYCHKHYQEKVSIKRVRELRIKIQNELRDSEHKYSMASDSTEQPSDVLYAKT